MRIDKRILENMADWMRERSDIPQGWIYLGDGRERYLLRQPGKRNMLVFGVNPSNATPGVEHDDPTIRKVRKLTASAGYDGLWSICIRRSHRTQRICHRKQTKIYWIRI